MEQITLVIMTQNIEIRRKIIRHSPTALCTCYDRINKSFLSAMEFDNDLLRALLSANISIIISIDRIARELSRTHGRQSWDWRCQSCHDLPQNLGWVKKVNMTW